MIKVLQYGEGNFLRTFVDAYFDILNKECVGEYQVNIVKPIAFGTLDKFDKQNNKYHIVLRGMENGNEVEKVYAIDSLASVIAPFTNDAPYHALAKDKDLKIIVSNTTEAGICYNENDKIDGFDGITYPAKLTKFLYERYNAGREGVHNIEVVLTEDIGCYKKRKVRVLNHQLTSIALNSISKWRARNLCFFRDYYARHGKIPANMTVGFSYLMAILASLTREGDKYYAEIAGKKIEIMDDKPNLEYFANGGSICEFMKNESVWGEDLTRYEGFLDAVIANVEKIKKGEKLI